MTETNERSAGMGRWAWAALGLAGVLLATAVGTRAARDGEPAAQAAPGGTEAKATPPGGSVDAAVTALEKRLADNPKDIEGWKMLGWSYFQTGRHADAVGAYEKAVALKGDDAELWSALGEARTLKANGVDPSAHQAFTKAATLDPKDARARYFLGVEKDVAGDHRGAVDLWVSVLKDAPADAPYAQSVRDLVMQVSTKNGIDVAGRMPPPPMPPAVPPVGMAGSGPLGGDGAAAASAAIPGPTQEQLFRRLDADAYAAGRDGARHGGAIGCTAGPESKGRGRLDPADARARGAGRSAGSG